MTKRSKELLLKEALNDFIFCKWTVKQEIRFLLVWLTAWTAVVWFGWSVCPVHLSEGPNESSTFNIQNKLHR